MSKISTALRAHCGALAACRRCGHAHQVRPIVAAAAVVGAPRAMLVGQAPGKVEAEGGRPFAGRAGKTLFRWLARAGLDEAVARRHIYIAAVTRCYPGPSSSGRGDRVPSLAEQANCADWLDQELRLIRPRLLIPVGRLSIGKFLPPLALDQLIGREHVVRHAGGTSVVVPLPHPSGASSWIHQGDHPRLLDRALALLHARFTDLDLPPHEAERSRTPAPRARSVA